MRTAGFIACLLFCTSTLLAQSPDARETYRKIREEVQRAFKAKDYPALIDANKRALEFTHGNSRWLLNLAGCYALAGRKDEAFRTLLRAADMKIDGSSVAEDDDFASLKPDPRWSRVLDRFKGNREKIGYTNAFLKLSDPELLTEDIAWSRQTGSLYLTSVRKKKVLRIANKSDVSTFVDLSSDPGWPLMAAVVDDKTGTLWVTAAAMPDFELSPKADWGRSALLEIDLASGKIRHRFDLPDDGAPHVLGDAALLPSGELIVSDGSGGAVYRFRKGVFTRIDHGEFISPQTPAVSVDGRIIVPDYVRGLALLAPDSPTPVSWITNSAQVLNGIDGLYFDPVGHKPRPTLFAIQNGVAPLRILAIQLDPDLHAVKSADVLLSNADGLGEPTHGAFVGDDAFYFIVNSGWNQIDDHGNPKTNLKPTPPEIGQLRVGSRESAPPFAAATLSNSIHCFPMKSVIIGTAGHIDHGKSALVRALTGTDPDRWEEEKRRGITIDLGFASLDLKAPNSELIRLGFVDVPGHERFVRNMLAGVGGMDIVLLIVSADEGIKPQTREHFDICRLLSIPRGIVVLTKSDLVDPETLDVVRLEVAEFVRGSFLDGASIVPVSAMTGSGLDQLRSELLKAAAEIPAKDTVLPFRLPIDRVFTMKGFGTVITGTLISGRVEREQEIEILPERVRSRVRGIQVHGETTDIASAGQRTALNLAGLSTNDLRRGQMLVQPDTLRATDVVDAWLTLLPDAKPLKQRAPVHVHIFTEETVARVLLLQNDPLQPGSSAYVHLHLANPTALVAGDRFIIRQFSPLATIGGGVVLDTAPRWRRRHLDLQLQFLNTMRTGTPGQVLLARIVRRAEDGLILHEAIAETGWTGQHVNDIAQALAGDGAILRSGDLLVSRADINRATEDVLFVINKFHDQNPLAPGVGREELREKAALSSTAFELVMQLLTSASRAELLGEVVRAQGRGVQMKDEEAEAKQIIETAFSSAGLKVPALKEVMAGLKIDRIRAQKIVTLLLRDRILIKLSDDLVFHRDTLEQLKQQVRAMKANSTQIDVATFKDATGITRKYAIPLLEYLDRERVTRRVGDARQIL